MSRLQGGAFKMKKVLIMAIALTVSACTSKSIDGGVIEVESINLEKETAIVEIGNFEFSVAFDARYFPDGDGFQTWQDAEITNAEITGYDYDEGVEYVPSQEEVIEIKNAVESKLRSSI